MPRSDWGELSKVGGLGLLLGALCIWTWAENVPPKPTLPSYEYGQAAESNYHPGGANCQPQNLTRLAGQKGVAERERCAEEAEDHRLQSDDLVQQTRAADAAQASANYAFLQTRLMLLGIILGILTLVAAGFAAIYARKAFLTQEHSFKLLGRPFLYLEKIKAVERWPGCYRIELRVRNSGASPATNVRAKVGTAFYPTDQFEPPVFDYTARVPTIAPGTRRLIVTHVFPSPDELVAIYDFKSWLCVFLDLTFDTRFRKDKNVCDTRATFAPDFLERFWIPQNEDRPLAPEPTIEVDPIEPGLFDSESDEKGA